MKIRLFCLLGLVALALVGESRAATAVPVATVEYTTDSPAAPAPGLTFPDTAPWLGWAGAPMQASWDGITAQLTLYLPDPVSLCPAEIDCVATPVIYRRIMGWQSVTVLRWPDTVPWYLGYAGAGVPYTVDGDRLILQLGPQ